MASEVKRKYFYGLEDELINTYIEGLGFRTCADGFAKYGEFNNGSKKTRYLCVSSGGFGVDRGKTVLGQIFYPPKNCWEALRSEKRKADIIFIFVAYDNGHAWSFNGRKGKGRKIVSNLPNWWGHSGLIVIESGEKWKYYDCQFYDGIKVSGHFAYEAVTTSIQRKIREVMDMEKVGIKVEKFSQHVG